MLPLRKRISTQYRQASLRLNIAQRNLASNNTPKHRSEWHEAKQAFDTWAEKIELMNHAHKLLSTNLETNRVNYWLDYVKVLTDQPL